MIQQEVVQETFGQQLQERAINLIDTLAAQLGVAAEHVYTVLGKQMFLEGLVVLITLTFAMVLTGGLARMTWRRWVPYTEKSHTDESEDALMIFLVFVSVIALLATTVATFMEGPVAIMKLLNPEYYVIKELLSVL